MVRAQRTSSRRAPAASRDGGGARWHHLVLEAGDERALVDPGAHRDILDLFGRHDTEVSETRRSWNLWRQAEADLARHRARVEAAAREADYLRASVEELDKLDPMDGEETELAGLRSSMMKAEKIASEIGEAQELFAGNASPVPLLASLVRRLERKSAEAPGLLEEVVKSLDEALIALDAAQTGIDAAMRATEFDPKRLEQESQQGNA